MSDETERLIEELESAATTYGSVADTSEKEASVGVALGEMEAASVALNRYIERIERERDEAQASLSWCLAPVPDDDPLRPLGSYLADAFDEDQWLAVEPLLNGARKRIAALEEAIDAAKGKQP